MPSTAENQLAGVEAEVLTRHHKWAVLALVAVGTFMTALDASIVRTSFGSRRTQARLAWCSPACAALGAVGILAALVRGQDRGIAR